MAQESQRNQPRNDQPPQMPSSGDKSPQAPGAGKTGPSDDLANSADRNASENDNRKNEPRRYDEADPNWRNPDVQMDQSQTNNPSTTSKDTLM